MFSSLTTKVIESLNRNIRKNAELNPEGIINGITIHHTGCLATAESVARNFTLASRQASANYVIRDDVIIGCVPEEFRAWTSGGRLTNLGITGRMNDYKKITIEVCNSTGNPTWQISKESYQTLIRLCADICKRYNIVPTFTGNSNGSFTYHYMFCATACPGPYIRSITGNIITDVNAMVRCGNPEIKPEPKPDASYLFKVTCDDLNIRTGPGTRYKVCGHITDKGTYTIVEEQNNWGRLKSGAGWICLRYGKKVK